MGLRDRLRTDTRAAHDALDQLFTSFDPIGSTNGYGAFLRGNYRLYSSYGKTLDWVAERVELPALSSGLLEVLRDDLRGDIPDVEEGTILRQEARRWGVAYALEGWAVGAPGMLTTLRRRPQLQVSTYFLSSLVAASAGRWPAFLLAVDQLALNAREVSDGAVSILTETREIFAQVASSRKVKSRG